MFQILLLLLLAMGKGYHPAGYEPVLKMLNDLYLEEFFFFQDEYLYFVNK